MNVEVAGFLAARARETTGTLALFEALRKNMHNVRAEPGGPLTWRAGVAISPNSKRTCRR